MAEFFARRDLGACILGLVGESHYQANIRAARRRRDERLISVKMTAEPANQFDPNAVQVSELEGGAVLGYLNRSAAKQFQKTVLQLGEAPMDAIIVGGGRGKTYGVWVDASPVRKLYDADPKRAARRAKSGPPRPVRPTARQPVAYAAPTEPTPDAVTSTESGSPKTRRFLLACVLIVIAAMTFAALF